MHPVRLLRWIPVLRRTITVALFAASGLTLSCGRGPDNARPTSLLLVVVDTVRGDRPGYAGYAKAVTPTLDSLAAHGVAFADAMTPAPLTLPAVTSLLTGRLPIHHRVRDNDKFTLTEGEETLADRFRAAGYRTGAVLGSAILSRDRGLARGFETYDDQFAGPYALYDSALVPVRERLAATERRAGTVTDHALKLLTDFGDARWFALVHYFDVHMFYDPPPSYRAMHPDSPYDGEISYVDAEIGRLLRGLPHPDRTLVVVVSDHGESNGEHGEPQHGFLLYQSTLHVMALAAGPGVRPGVVRKDLVSLIDFEPTLARFFDLPAAHVRRDGRAMRLDRPETGAVPEYAEAFHPLVSYGWSALRAVRVGHWKYIEGGGRKEMYNLAEDPSELKDLSPSGGSPDFERTLTEMSDRDDEDAALAASAGHPDASRTQMLEGLGYFGGGASTSTTTAAAKPGPRPHPRDALPLWLKSQEAKSLFKEAYAKVTSKEPAAALPILDKALGLDPKFSEAWYLRGYARRQIGDVSGARADLEKALAIQPDNAAAREEMADMNRKEPGRSGMNR